MLTSHAWFGPRGGHGWGWAPITWQGQAISILCIVIVIGAVLIYSRRPGKALIISFGAVAALIVTCMLTGTAPG